MKRTKLLAYIFNLYSMSAVAGYDCVLHLYNNQQLDQPLAVKSMLIEQDEMRAFNPGTLLVERTTWRRKQSLELNATLGGWTGDEHATFLFLRKQQRRFSADSEAITEPIQLKGNQEISHWFDKYVVNIKCQTSR
jgi:hypothetical protein